MYDSVSQPQSYLSLLKAFGPVPAFLALLGCDAKAEANLYMYKCPTSHWPRGLLWAVVFQVLLGIYVKWGRPRLPSLSCVLAHLVHAFRLCYNSVRGFLLFHLIRRSSQRSCRGIVSVWRS
ncbi:hypothetical protein EDC04DRAFT_2175549 [Pisolithus marmoratus]|nr:hypothetical protein EDC04DRAFT_2175549 [Pisolithus marmoratus]